MTREEWTKRYAQRIFEVGGFDAESAMNCAETGACENFSENGDVWLDPEEAADIEMSYWEE